MEKLCYVIQRDQAESREGFNRRQLEDTRAELLSLGVGRLKISVADATLDPGAELYPEARRDAPDAMVSFWLNSAHSRGGAEAALARSGAWMAGYAVLESTALPVFQAAEDGIRDEGFTQIAFFSTLPGLSREEMLKAWLDGHTTVATETQSTFQYRQNIVVRALTPAAPAWDCIVEETFPLPALTDKQIFFDAGGSEEKLAANYERLMQSCARFIDFASMRLLLCSDFRFGGWGDLPEQGFIG